MENRVIEMLVEKRTHHRKKHILVLAAVLCCLSVMATGTIAYFTAEETAYNVITTGVLSMDLVEETTGGEPWPDGERICGVVPGMIVDKVPYVVNDGGIDFYTRLSMTMKVTGADGNELSAEYISLDINETEWTEKDGYYYYNEIVAPTEKTEPLFTKVTFAKEMPNAYMNAQIEIEVAAEAVQSKNNGDSALTASGWKVE